ncbi:hypothetical protein BC831DRAFT_25810 [Entophlyctis helioformis]|nr:hypothetical protein BC831DRAFT_25810 [Entophlyctis helioformis]
MRGSLLNEHGHQAICRQRIQAPACQGWRHTGSGRLCCLSSHARLTKCKPASDMSTVAVNTRRPAGPNAALSKAVDDAAVCGWPSRRGLLMHAGWTHLPCPRSCSSPMHSHTRTAAPGSVISTWPSSRACQQADPTDAQAFLQSISLLTHTDRIAVPLFMGQGEGNVCVAQRGDPDGDQAGCQRMLAVHWREGGPHVQADVCA